MSESPAEVTHSASLRSGTAIRARFTVDSCARRRSRFDTLSDTLRSGHGCDFWTRLDPEFANSLSKTTDLDTSGRGWTAHNVIRNQQVSGSSPLAGSNKLNNSLRSRVQTDPTRVTTVSPPIRRWIGLATPTPRRSTNSSGQPAHSTRGQPSPPPDRCGTDRRSPASLKASDTNQPPAAEVRPAGRRRQ